MKDGRQNGEVLNEVITELQIREGTNCTLIAVPLTEANSLMRILPMAIRCKMIGADSYSEFNIFILRLACNISEYFEVLVA